MSSIKDILIETIKRIPEDVTFEDIAKEIFSIGLVLENLNSEGKIILTDEVLKKVDECKKNEKFNQKIEMRYLTWKAGYIDSRRLKGQVLDLVIQIYYQTKVAPNCY